jgi:hypothetical protein
MDLVMVKDTFSQQSIWYLGPVQPMQTVVYFGDDRIAVRTVDTYTEDGKRKWLVSAYDLLSNVLEVKHQAKPSRDLPTVRRMA